MSKSFYMKDLYCYSRATAPSEEVYGCEPQDIFRIIAIEKFMAQDSDKAEDSKRCLPGTSSEKYERKQEGF